MISKKHINKEAAKSIIEKLAWAITKPDDWGLRYSACLALEEISTNQSTELLTMASRLESDAVVLMRINLAKRKTVNL
jgi:phycocyanobilin lyase alpha subunit